MTELTPEQQAVLDAIDVEEMVADLTAMVRTPSVTGSDAESELQHSIAASLTDLGLDVDTWRLDLDALTADPDFPGTEAPRTEGYGVVATSEGEGEPALVLQGHTDVVPVGDLAKWADRDPFSGSVTGDVLHGRGACDMKAGTAANIAVARALLRSGLTLERPFALHHVVSEEDGGLGAFATLRRGHRGEVAVITEPTSGRLVVANAGALTFEIRVHGLAAHGSTRLEGVSAYEAFTPVYAALRSLEQRRNSQRDSLFGDNPLPYGISVGRISAGDWASSVPDLLVAEGRLGVRLGEDPADARRELVEAIADSAGADPWLRDHAPEIAWTGGQFASGQLDRGHPLIEEVAGAVELVGGSRPPLGAAPYGSDLRLYAGVGGIPTLHFGPGDVRFAHAPREQVSISELVHVTRALAAMATFRLGAHR
ncbi:MAG: ArgE/DapE family deacylase [Micrococcales bacterium]|nr:ArgE/DapE family deacylase [Micrococcales bacterium]